MIKPTIELTINKFEARNIGQNIEIAIDCDLIPKDIIDYIARQQPVGKLMFIVEGCKAIY